MNRKRSFDDLLTAWLDEAADFAPERFVWAALAEVERVPQRGRWRAGLEGLLMRLQPAAPFLGVAAVVVAAIALYIGLTNTNVGGPPSSQPPTPAPSVSASRLPAIALITSGMPEGFTMSNSADGQAALVAGVAPGEAPPETGFVDGQFGQFTDPANDLSAATWVVLFETSEQADQMFRYMVDEHESAGWDFDRLPDAPALGDESVAFDGAAALESGTTYLWRSGRLVLAAVGVEDFDRQLLLEIAIEMQSRVP